MNKILLYLLIILLSINIVYAVNNSVIASQDCHVSVNEPDVNKDEAASPYVQNSAELLGYFQFEIPDEYYDNVTLYWYIHDDGSGASTHYWHVYNDTFDETTITYNNRLTELPDSLILWTNSTGPILYPTGFNSVPLHDVPRNFSVKFNLSTNYFGFRERESLHQEPYISYQVGSAPASLTVTLNDYDPGDNITYINLLPVGGSDPFEANYTYTHTAALNVSTISLQYQTNHTGSDSSIIINGTAS